MYTAFLTHLWIFELHRYITNETIRSLSFFSLHIHHENLKKYILISSFSIFLIISLELEKSLNQSRKINFRFSFNIAAILLSFYHFFYYKINENSHN